jgi:hypothetical protein
MDDSYEDDEFELDELQTSANTAKSNENEKKDDGAIDLPRLSVSQGSKKVDKRKTSGKKAFTALEKLNNNSLSLPDFPKINSSKSLKANATKEFDALVAVINRSKKTNSTMDGVLDKWNKISSY